MEIIRHIKVDLYGDTQHFAVAAKQMDMGTRYIGVTLMEDGVVYEIPDNVEVIINMTKPDKTHVHNDGEKSGNEALIPLTRGMLQVHGTALCEVQLYQNGALLTSATFEMEIFPSQRDESEIIHSGEYTRLENTIAAAREALQIAQDTQNTIDAAEAVRQAQERLREAAEKAREIKESRREDDTAKAIVKCVEAMEAAIEQTKKCLTDGNVLPVTYFPMYEGSVVNNRMRSLSGLTPTASMTDEQETTAAKQNGDRWDKQSFSEINLMYEMCTMITCSTNSQGKFGNGNSQSDNFLQTGTLNGKGQFFGYTSTTQAVKVFYCENFFANYWKRLRGLLLINGVYHVKAVPPYNSTGAGYTNTGLTPSGTSGGYCSRMEMASDIGRIPTVASGSETTYECDGLWFNNTIVAVALFGGRRGYGSKCGLSYWYVDTPATYVFTSIVASLSCKPPVAAA